MRLPVAEKIALVTAGMIGGNAGSPRPVGGLLVFRKCTSISFGAWFIRTRRWSLKVDCCARPLTNVVSWAMTAPMPSMTDPWTWCVAFSGLITSLPMSAATQTLFTFTRFCASTDTSAISAK